jgi:putative ABC transport system permease protein
MPDWKTEIRARLASLNLEAAKEAGIVEEISQHLEDRFTELQSKGAPAEAARQAVLAELSADNFLARELKRVESPARTEPGALGERKGNMLEQFFGDLKYGARMLRKNPRFTAVAVLTLAIGIGANTAIFSFVNAILLRPLPYKEPGRLVMVFENFKANGSLQGAVAAPMLGEWRKQSSVFEGLGAVETRGFILTGKERPENARGARLSANIFSLLGVEPFLGRGFVPEEENYGKDRVVLLSYELWQRRFAGDPKIIGQNIALNSEPYVVVGVMPQNTFFPENKTQIWAPLAFSPDDVQQRHAHRYSVYGRLKPGVTLARAGAEMDVIARHMEQADAQNKGWGSEVHPLRGIMVGDSRRVLLVLLCSVGLVLLIACVNIANLLFARSATRQREFAIRAALGAERGQMVRQLLTESLLLAVLGGSAGTLMASAGLKTLLRFAPPDLPRVAEGIHLDGQTLVFTAAITLFTGIAFGLIPALQSANPALAKDLGESGRSGSGGVRRQRLRSGLVVAEVAFSLILLIGAGLMIRSFSRLVSQSLGYNPEHLISMDITLPDKKYPDEGGRGRLFGLLLEQVRALPDVQSAALAAGLPLSGWQVALYVRVLDAPPVASNAIVVAEYAQISPGYFHTMNIPLLQGRDFTDQDRSNAPPVVIVDETFVKNFKLATNVIGRRIQVGDGTESAEIVGLVKDTKKLSLAQSPRGNMYRSYQQKDWGYHALVIRTQSDPAQMTRIVRAELDALDKDQPVENIRTMTQLISASVGQQRLTTELLGGFASVAMLLAAIGLYGVLAGSVAQRTREIGIRMALGAQRVDVLKLVLGEGLRLTVAGLLLGLAGALVLTRLMSSLLYEIKPFDSETFLGVSVLMAWVALCACYLPARRVTKVDPMVALRYE